MGEETELFAVHFDLLFYFVTHLELQDLGLCERFWFGQLQQRLYYSLIVKLESLVILFGGLLDPSCYSGHLLFDFFIIEVIEILGDRHIR